ncbi:hypothetical protein KVR01_010493 [Diaporthe batatas]|uniref:uncharacterized protein n=1 Tax=Diaporthe batatas TaxID=748121 RepID=UPI001D051A1B|nr:uncharacterized protein KVR01_010493 [Diaporthe batatas]KAG8159856.1 hypothetical protein KVR01_010493 [Diaporthe batatas]
MAPPHMFKASKPAFQPKAGGKPVASRVEKTKSHAKVAKRTFFANALTFRPKEAAPADSPADPMMLDSPEPAATEPATTQSPTTQSPTTEPAPIEPAPTEPAPTEPAPTEPAPTEPAPIEPASTDSVMGNPPVASATSATHAAGDENEEEDEHVDKPFKLGDGIPKAGFQFRKEGPRGRSILGRFETENIVVEALYPDMDIIHKSKAQGVISPVFHEAANMVEDGIIEEHLVRIGKLVPGHSRRIWRWFFGRLWVDSKSKWPRRLSQQQFIHFVSCLAEARWREENSPKNPNGEKPGLLAQNVSLFLNVAEEKGFAWSNGGEAFGDKEE